MPTETLSRPRWVVIYDDTCGFCTRSARLGRALDWLRRFDWLPRSSPRVLEQYPQAHPDQTERRMAAIAPDGGLRLGFYAVREIWLREPLLFLGGLVMWLPLVDRLGVPAYDWVARNRHRLGGSNACQVRR